ncbi:hypothetical protein G9A89_008334, partial [Geosiphon pyriformis]
MSVLHSLPKLNAELIIRLIFGLSIFSIIVAMTIPTFFRVFIYQDPLISISINHNTSESGIPVPNALLCLNMIIFPYLKNITVLSGQDILFGSIDLEDNGRSSNETRLVLRKIGRKFKCLAFKPESSLKYYQEAVDFVQIIFYYRNEYESKINYFQEIWNEMWKNEQFGFVWVTYDSVNGTYQERESIKIKPNQLTAITLNPTERIDVNGNSHWYKNVPDNFKEDPIPGYPFNLVEVWIYPINSLVTQYTEKNEVTWIDIFTDVGGLLAYASGVWIILFGRGRFKSWGYIQQYILKTAPNANIRGQKQIKGSPILPIEDFKKNLYSPSENSQSDTLSSVTTFLSTSNFGEPFQCNFDSINEKSSIKGESSYSEKNLQSCNRLPKIVLDYENSHERMFTDDLQVLQRKVNLIEKMLCQEYLEGFGLETFDKMNQTFNSEKLPELNIQSGMFINKGGYKSRYISPILEITRNAETLEYGIVMDFAKYGDMRKYLAKNLHSTSWPDKLEIAQDIAFGLDSIHSSGMVHRDLHSGNILQYVKDEVTIGDLGLCQPTNTNNEATTTEEKKIYGVIPYIPPE